jgi:hypothetical protein
MLANVYGWLLNDGGVAYISLVHLVGALGLILALTVTDLCWTAQPLRRWSATSTEPPTPKKRSRVNRPALSNRPVWAGVHR